MKTKKVLLGSLILAGVVTACTDENIVEGVQNNMPLTERTQVNLTLSASEIDSRMSNGSGWDSNFETFDVLGAVLVDKGYAAKSGEGIKFWNNVDWTVIDGHVGNNKWSFDSKKGKFVTEGTTAVGSWLFYTKYNEKMTTTRNGVEFNFPQIQEGSTNLEWVMNNNANFMISPVAHIDGYEGQNLEFKVEMASVFSYLRMPFDLKATGATQVQKIVVKAESAEGVDVEFPTEYKVVNTALPEARLSLESDLEAIACPEYNSPANGIDVYDQNQEMLSAYNKMVYSHIDTKDEWMDPKFQYSVIDRSNGQTTVDYLVVDLDGEHADKSGKGGLTLDKDGRFSAVMLMPAGVYYSLTFDIYTDKGVWTKEVTSMDEFYENLSDADKKNTKYAKYDDNKIFLRPGRTVMLSDVTNKFGNKVKEEIVAEEYIKVTNKSTDKQYITKTADLINFINGITAAKTTCEVNVISQEAIGGGVNDDATIPEHSIIVNQEVMDAIVKKENALGKDIQLIFKGATIKVKGNTEAGKQLNIHDMTFNNGAEVISGYVKATESVNVPTEQKILVKSGVNLELALVQGLSDEFNSIEIENGATVKATTSATVGNLLNKGTFNIAANKTIASTTVTNKGTATVEGTWNVSTELTNAAYANLTNKGVMTLAGKATNNGTLTNNKDINVHGAMTNNSNVTIAANAKIHVNSSATASLLNNGTIVNNGMLYTKVGYDNTITNLGTIDSKSGSTTYITKNSKADESTTATNESAQIMGTLKIAERNLDITVTMENHQGYIEYTPVAADIVSGVFTAIESGDDTQDKFNKVIFSSAVKLIDAERVKYIVTSKNLNLVNASVNEVTFTGNATLYTQGATIASLTIEDDVLVKVPTINEVYVKTIESPSLTNVSIHNEGEILVGGDLYTTILGKQYTTGGGEFSAGDGNESAFHWGYNLSEDDLEEELEKGYQINGNVATVVNNTALNTVLANDKVTEIKLSTGDFDINTAVVSGKEKTIVGNGETTLQLENSGGQNSLSLGKFNEFTIRDCKIGRMKTKNWGHLVLGSSNNEKGIYNIINCTFEGEGTQGIYINEEASGATYNIENCTFNGDFGTEGAITIQCNENVNYNLNVKGCTFNNIPSTSHKIFVIYQNTEDTVWNLDTDVPLTEIKSVVRFW